MTFSRPRPYAAASTADYRQVSDIAPKIANTLRARKFSYKRRSPLADIDRIPPPPFT